MTRPRAVMIGAGIGGLAAAAGLHAALRRHRIRAILERALLLGLIDSDADLEVAVTMATGSWYARALSGDDPPPGWPARAAALVWRSVSGATPPDPQPAERRPLHEIVRAKSTSTEITAQLL